MRGEKENRVEVKNVKQRRRGKGEKSQSRGKKNREGKGDWKEEYMSIEEKGREGEGRHTRINRGERGNTGKNKEVLHTHTHTHRQPFMCILWGEGYRN